MIFGWLKHYMPRSLYGRAALILLLPVVVLQVVVGFVFSQRYFEDVTEQMSDAVLREIRAVVRVIDNTGYQTVSERLGALEIAVTPVDESALNAPHTRAWIDISGRVVTSHLTTRMPQIAVVDLTRDKHVRLVLGLPSGAYELVFDRRRVSAVNPHQLFVYMVFFSIVFTLIALIYLRNQLRPIKRLAAAADAFGKGQVIPYVPAGATEVRAAGTAFTSMRARIDRQIETRTLMLSGVSHDLRTPLTRMRLSLSMLEDDERTLLEQDVQEMQSMIDAFLDFSKGAQEGVQEPVNIGEFIQGAVSGAQRAGRDVTLVHGAGQGTVMLREGAMRRALDNLIGNAVRYGTRAEVSYDLTEKSLRIRVEDDGPGIPEDRRAEAQRPFSRLDEARNQNQGSGVGLGLAIATDIARAHGGVLRLGASERLGGLAADIVIAR